MNFVPLRRLQSKLTVAFVAAAALVIASCGGGGATSSPNNVGPLQLQPSTSSLYAGVPYTFTIVGGRKPYLVTSSEQTLVELNFTTDSNSFTFVPRNPGVVDVGLDPNEVPRRTVNIDVRDSNGSFISNPYNVLQNFFTGYGESYSSTCASNSAGNAPQACSGADSIVTLIPVSNGALYGNREFQFDRVRGDYSFVVEDPTVVPQLVNQIRVRTDQTGRAHMRIRVNTNAGTQFASYKVTDILTGVTMDIVFLIVQQPSADVLTVLPSDTLTFTGTLATQCGTGSSDVFVFGGTPPYTVLATGGVSASPTTLAASGDRLTINAASGLLAPCPTGTAVTISDSRGARAVVTVNIVAGSGTPPALVAAPTTVATLACGLSTQVTVVGGVGGLLATSQHPRITATISGPTLTLTRVTGDGATIYPTASSVTVTDGASIITIGITATPANCP